MKKLSQLARILLIGLGCIQPVVWYLIYCFGQHFAKVHDADTGFQFVCTIMTILLGVLFIGAAIEPTD